MKTLSGLFAILTLASAAFPGPGASVPLRIGAHDYSQVLETPHPYPGSASGLEEPVWSNLYEYPGAKYVVVEFKRFDLDPGDRVVVSDPKGGQAQTFQGRGFLDQGGDFITRSVFGPAVMITLFSRNPEPKGYGYRIERLTRGYSDDELAALYGVPPAPESTCGANDQKDAVCYQSSYPSVYAAARPVVRIVMDGSALCTGWLVSCENHFITNNHCTWDDNDFDTQAELNRMEFQFMYQDATCGGGGATTEYSFVGGTWLENHHNLDFTLIKAPPAENPAATYGWVRWDLRVPAIDELMYVVGHPSGRPKEISLQSTDASDPTGFAEIYSVTEAPCIGGTHQELGYMADTEGGNSGSPVFSRTNDKAIGLHHCGGCPNTGMRIVDVYNQIQAAAPVLPACTTNTYAGTVALDDTQYGCTESMTITVSDDSTPPKGTGSVAVTVRSAYEPTPETVTLTETPPNSGVFTGAFPLSPDAAVHGDGKLSVNDGDTVTVRYIDADDGQGGVNIPREDSAAVGCMPSLQHQSHLVVDDCAAGGAGDADSVLDAGESALIQVTAINTGTLPATGVTATLSTATPGITITDPSASFPNLSVGGTGASVAPHFSVAVDDAVACGTDIAFDLAFTAAQGG